MCKVIFILALIAMPYSALAYSNPGKPTGYVSDFANIISTETRNNIENRLTAFYASTSIQVAVVTIDSLGGDTIENFAVQLFKDWGIGKKGINNGVLLLVAPNERELKIEIGYGLEGSLTDIQSGIIIRNMVVPAFKANDYSKGISDAVDAMIAIISKSPEANSYLSGSDSNTSKSQIDFPFVFFVFIVITSMFARILGKTKSWWLGGVIGATMGIVIGIIWGFANIGTISIIVLTILGLIFDFIVSKHPPTNGRSGMWFGGIGGRGGSGFGGGFGGFGGGLSGGGGASGRW